MIVKRIAKNKRPYYINTDTGKRRPRSSYNRSLAARKREKEKREFVKVFTKKVQPKKTFSYRKKPKKRKQAAKKRKQAAPKKETQKEERKLETTIPFSNLFPQEIYDRGMSRIYPVVYAGQTFTNFMDFWRFRLAEITDEKYRKTAWAYDQISGSYEPEGSIFITDITGG